ncbi:SIS domain-containing protein [Catellatospora citrea]|uniref:SIS domain-containing protein n=1 Tax=Catellatospora citrea TaxID=53366 RepID=UPI0014771E2B|nr:SIS domain-containing protein [Catellatospora citrea]
MPLTDDEALALVENAARRAAFAASTIAASADSVVKVARQIAESLARGGKILVFGNGGSAACAQHFAAEFSGKLSVDRRPMAAISLTVDTSALTAIANDYGYHDVFARQVTALGRPGDVVVGLSTSGTSANVKAGLAAGRAIGATTVSLTGRKDELDADWSITIPMMETARIQEAHDVILHELAQVSERLLIPGLTDDASADRFPFLLTEDQLESFGDWTRASGQALVTTNGVFDVLHAGHYASLGQARSLGDRLVVLVNSDESVRALKGPTRPMRTLEDRLSDLRRSADVDHVVVMPDSEPSRLLGKLRPTVHTKGADYRSKGIIEAETVIAGGGRIEYLDLVSGYSTTALETKVRAGAR